MCHCNVWFCDIIKKGGIMDGTIIKDLRKQKKITQLELSQLSNISRSKISAIESNKRNISVEDLKKFANIFGISTDMLIYGTDIMITEKENNLPVKSQRIRIDIPQKNLEKFREVLLYVLNKVGAYPNIGETVINKLIYFIDFDYYEKYEEQIIGATYIKNHHGPTPIELIKVLENMINKDIVVVKNEYFGKNQKKFIPLRESNLALLSARETELIDAVLAKLSHLNAKQISDYSHKDVPYLYTGDGQQIKYEAVFYRTVPYSARNYE
jgi:transcriptional regulator with XRE-family HTH domain